MRAAVIENGKVTNVILVDNLFAGPAGLVLVDAEKGGAIGDEWDGKEFKKPAPPAVDLAALKKRLATQIDEAAVAVFAKPTTLARVYERREAEAKAFVDSDFAGVPGEYLVNFADPAGMPYADAAKLVLQQAANLRQAQDQLEALRMRKNEILRAADAGAAEAIAIELKAGIAQIAALIG